jgi:2-oxoisovalerate dehydrogenase E1 component
MAHGSARSAAGDAAGRLRAFAAERFTFALPIVERAIDPVARLPSRPAPTELEDAARSFRAGLAAELRQLDAAGVPDSSPGVSASTRLEQACAELLDACDGFLAREIIAASITPGERLEILRGMLLTRALDNRLKQFFSSGEVTFRGTPFQGKGFRSLGQEAIYAAAIRLRRGAAFRDAQGRWQGDVVGPIIRDAGVALAMRPEPATVRMVLNAQMGKAGAPMGGKDLHIGDLDWGILPASAPLSISTMSIAGMALAFARERSGRVAVSFIGEGGASLGEWHEAINLCAARRLPAVFCLENNHIALSTPLPLQSAARVFADKAAGYGIPGITIDGTEPDAIAAAFTWAAGRAREGRGPALIEVVTLRMSGHAHHDDMLYLGRERRPSWEYVEPSPDGYADRELFEYWARKDPIASYAARLETDGILPPGDLEQLKRDAEAMVEVEAQAVVHAAWPDAATAGDGVFADESTRSRADPLDPAVRSRRRAPTPLPPLEPLGQHDPKGQTFLEAIAQGLADVLRSDSRAFIFGEDVGAPYGNAFLMLRPLLAEFGERILDSPLAESAVLGASVGAALAGLHPIAEMQFNDFVASGFNQLVNNAAKIRYRWGGSVPMVVRMPWGGLRHAGPYHSQNTEAWFYRTPGLKVVVPSTAADARALLIAAAADPDPVLFYEHIALYRDPRLKQRLPSAAPEPLPIGSAALRRAGHDLVIVSYGAYVHVALRVAERLAAAGIDASVLDLRTLVPLDRESLLATARHCSRVLIVHEDTRTGGVGESLAAIVQEEAFEWLDAPVRVVAALDTPVPYSPPLEERFLPSADDLERAARLLVAY